MIALIVALVLLIFVAFAVGVVVGRGTLPEPASVEKGGVAAYQEYKDGLR